MDITVILTGYNRPQNLEPQLEAIKNQTIKAKEFMLWYNKGTEPQIDLPEVKTAKCNFNCKFHGRFAMALLAQTPYVAIFDDDAIPGTHWFENCLNTMKTHEGILGTSGVLLQNDKQEGDHKVGWNGIKSTSPIEVAFVGQAWFLKRDWLKYLWMEEPISWDNGEDMQLSYLAQKYGNIKTFVPPHPPENHNLWGSIKGWELGTDGEASWRKPGHVQERNYCLQQAIAQGWKPLFSK